MENSGKLNCLPSICCNKKIKVLKKREFILNHLEKLWFSNILKTFQKMLYFGVLIISQQSIRIRSREYRVRISTFLYFSWLYYHNLSSRMRRIICLTSKVGTKAGNEPYVLSAFSNLKIHSFKLYIQIKIIKANNLKCSSRTFIIILFLFEKIVGLSQKKLFELIYAIKNIKMNSCDYTIHIYYVVITLLFLKEINSASSTSTTGTNNNIQLPIMNKVFNKTICTSNMDLYDAELISCPSGFKFSILNAYLFDFGNKSCILKQNQSIIPLEFIRNKIQSLCISESSCFIFKDYLISLYESYDSVTNLGCSIFWSCYRIRKEGQIFNQIDLKYYAWY